MKIDGLQYVLVGEHTEQYVANEYAQHKHRLGNVGQLEFAAHQVPLYKKIYIDTLKNVNMKFSFLEYDVCGPVDQYNTYVKH